MNRRLTYLLLFCLLLAALGCSTKKNTAATRSYHYTTAKYNINFNALQNYNKGIEQMQKSMIDDYSRLLPMYPISVHANGQAVAGTMDVVIEKCRKTIKQHSITKKPKKNPKKAKDPDYQHWYNQAEFNSQVVKAWLLLGKAEFSKADFIGSVGTFTYIARHYAAESAVVTEARIWMARAYAEMQWYYEAEEMLGKINENDVPRDLNGIFAAVKADLLLKEHQNNEAVPFLKIALEKEKDKYQQLRFSYILGQLALAQGDLPTANNYFRTVAKHAPNYTMEFNARMQMLTSETENLPKAIKALEKMAKSPNNKDYLDQIYYAIGNIYLSDNQKESAIEAYRKAVEESTRNGIDKATVLVKLGDLYYDDRQYIAAHPCFEEAVTIISSTHDDYDRVSRLSETLGGLAQNYNTVVLQDSLQMLSQLSPEEQRAIVDKLIEQVIAEEEEARQRAENEAAMAAAASDDDSFGGMTAAMGNTSGEWYFYNQQLIASGRAQFQRRWGKRKLEDNWRRLNKSAQFAEIADDEPTDDEALPDSVRQQSPVDDNKNPEFYLSQIPKTPEQMAQSNAEIAAALLAMADIYKNGLNDYEAAIETLVEYERRFPQGDNLLDCYYAQYQAFGQLHKEPEREAVRQKIVTQFPESKQAIVLSQPDYAAQVVRMYAMQDSLYAATYRCYSQNDFACVLANYDHMATAYPLSKLMPKFAFLRALSLGKTRPANEMKTALDDLVARYPQSDVASMAKDILALMSQGKEAQQGTVGNLAALRQQELQQEAEEPITEKSYTADHKLPFSIMFEPADAQAANRTLFDLAAYNFSKFLIKDYDLALRVVDEHRVVVLSGLENYDEAAWYLGLADKDEALRTVLSGCTLVLPIADDNLALINLLGFEAYKQFYDEKIR